jgi:hypothetical protein
VAALVCVCALTNLWWVQRFRDGYPLDIDESRYVAFGLALDDDLSTGHPRLAWNRFHRQDEFAPLLPLTAVPLFAVFGHDLTNAFLAETPYLILLAIAAYGIARRLSSRTVGLVVAATVLTAPGVTDFARTFQFALPSTALLTAATGALLASDGLLRRDWSIAWGALAGLAALSRTMMLAFLPGQALAAAWVIGFRPERRNERAANLGLGAAAALIVMLPWYAFSWRPVLGYLTGFGYGGESTSFGPSRSPLSLGYWGQEAAEAVQRDLYVPLAALIAVSILLGGFAVARSARRRGWGPLRDGAIAACRGDAVLVFVVVCEAYLALTSSRNQGVGFGLPLAPAAIALAAAILYRLPWRRLSVVMIGALAATAVFNWAMKADLWRTLSATVTAHPPAVRPLPVIEGQGYIQGYVRPSLEYASTIAGTPPPPSDPTRPLPSSQRRWLSDYAYLLAPAVRDARRTGTLPTAVITVDEPLVNPFALTLAARRRFHSDLAVGTLLGAATPRQYRSRLTTGPADPMPPALPATVITFNPPGAPFSPAHPPATQRAVERAARSLGFRGVETRRLPDGSVARVMTRPRRRADRN